jgi:hypothetical protein
LFCFALLCFDVVEFEPRLDEYMQDELVIVIAVIAIEWIE